jgi:Flp pilus assembly protein TadD
VALYSLKHFLPDLLGEFPALELNLQHDLSRRVTEAVVSLRVDIGIVVNPAPHPDLVLRKLCTDEVTFWTLPKHPQANLLSGIIACKQARFDEGVKFLKTAQEGLPNNADIYHNLGVAYSNLNKLADAEAAFAAEEKLRPSTQGVSVNRGVLALKQKKYKEAVTALNKAATEEPNNSKVWLYLADAKEGSNDKAGATEAKAKALALDPSLRSLRVELGQRFYEAGQLSRAAEVLTPLQDQGDAGAEFLLGVLAYKDGRFDDSRARFEAALKARADYSEARYNLAITVET